MPPTDTAANKIGGRGGGRFAAVAASGGGGGGGGEQSKMGWLALPLQVFHPNGISKIELRRIWCVRLTPLE